MVSRLTPFSSTSRRAIAYLSLTLIVLVGFIIRISSLESQSLWRDEVDAMCYAYDYPRALIAAVFPTWESLAEPPSACPPTPITSPPGEDGPRPLSLTKALAKIIRQNGPLYFFVLRAWINPAGTSVTALRFFSLWFGVLCIPLTYALGRRLMGQAAGAFASLLVATSPYLVWYSQEVKMYTLVAALALLAIYALRRAVDGGGAGWWATQVIATSLALYTHILSAFLIPVQMLFFVLWWPRSRRRWAGGLISFSLLTLPYLPLVIWQARYVFTPRETGFPRYTLQEMALTLLRRWSTGASGANWIWGAIILGASTVLGLIFLSIQKPNPLRRRTALGLVIWATLPLLGIWFVSRWQPLFTDRYLIWSTPAFYLLTAGGMSFLWQRGRWPMVPLMAATLVVFCGNLWLQATTSMKSDFRSAAAFMEEHYADGELIIFQIPHGRYTFDYYYSGDYVWRDGPYTNHVDEEGAYRISSGQAAAHMTAMTWQYDRVWLVSTEMVMWDRRGLVQAWLDTHGTRVREETFIPYVEVRLYDLTAPP
jgi:hypothetical protein